MGDDRVVMDSPISSIKYKGKPIKLLLGLLFLEMENKKIKESALILKRFEK